MGTFNFLQPTQEGATGAPSSPPAADEGAQAPTLTEEQAPVCLEGQVLDEQIFSGLMVHGNFITCRFIEFP